MNTYRYVILGGGPTAGYSAQEFVNQGVGKGELAIFSAEAFLPYDRPPLSKGFLTGDKDIEGVLIKPESFYKEHGIDVHLNARATRLDVDAGVIETEGGERFEYEKLLLATGSEVRRFDLDGAQEAGIQYLRTLDDAKRIRDAGAKADAPVVIGGGFIGLEVAASLALQGKKVRLLFPEEYFMQRIFTRRMATFFTGYYLQHGVEILPGNAVKRFAATNEGMEIHLASEQAIKADFVVAGVGVKPAVGLFMDTPIGVEDGVCVNEFLESTVNGVYAAGDVAAFVNPVTGKRGRVEHWQNAVDQGKLAARNMMGAHETHNVPPYFFSDMFDLSWEFWGRAEKGLVPLHVGNVEEGSFSTWWTDQQQIVKAVFVLNREDEERELAETCVSKAEKLPEEIEKVGEE
ncbi:MAG: FAD/NAD(P)-binding oxidoreductase [Candidatus Hydrogenedentota bacterium]